MSPEAERAVDAITIGVRHRQDLGDIDELAASIREIGLLQPIVITPDGVLVCGRRRLEAARRLGWRTIKVWIRSGISDRLTELLAQQDENSLHKPLTPLEQTDLYTELKTLYREETERRQKASRFGADDVPSEEISGGENGSDGPSGPAYTREARYHAAEVVTGSGGSFQRLDRTAFLRAVANDPFQPSTVRELATSAVTAVEAGAPVEPAYHRVQAAIELAAHPVAETDAVNRLSAEALDRVNQKKARRGLCAAKSTDGGGPEPASAPQRFRTLRSFLLTWADLEGWTTRYDLGQLARDLTAEEYARFDRVITESAAFRDALHQSRVALASASPDARTPART